MPVQATSAAAYKALTTKEFQCERLARMLLYVTNNGGNMTIGEMAKKCRFDQKGTVSARLDELRHKRTIYGKLPRTLIIDGAFYQVKEAGKRKCTVSGVTCLTWVMVPASQPSSQLEITLN